MVLSRRQATLYLFLCYVSWQLHEIGHWLVAEALGGKIVMGFDRWCLISLQGPLWVVLAAGPLTTLLLALIGLVLLTWRGSTAEEVGFSLAFFNSVFGLSSLAWGLATNPTHLDLLLSELAWKAASAPLLAFVLALALRHLSKTFKAHRAKLVAELLALTIAINLVVEVLDEWAWLGFEAGNPFFTTIHGFILPVVPVNAAAFSAFTALLMRYREKKSVDSPKVEKLQTRCHESA